MNTEHIKKVVIDLNIDTIPIEKHGYVIHPAIIYNPFNLIYGPNERLRRNHYCDNLDLEVLANQKENFKNKMNIKLINP